MAVFSVVKAARELKESDDCFFLGSLVEVAAVPSQDKKYAETLIDHYRKRVERVSGVEKPKANNVVPWEIATQILSERLAVKTRLEGG